MIICFRRVFMNIEQLLSSIYDLRDIKGVDIEVLGFSTFNRPIYVAHIGNYNGKQIFMEGGIHAREYLSSLFLIEEVKYLAEIYNSNPFNGGFYVVPVANPDGIALVLDGIESVSCEKQKQILQLINNGSNDYSLWKANGLGVDLNVNFNAEWGKGTQNVFCPSPYNFVGFYPNSERETQSLIDFLFLTNPQASISWHTKGEVIYYGFYTLSDSSLERDYKIAQEISKVNGYEIVKTSGSVGGLSDWVSMYLDVPAFTIELGNANLQHPLGREQLDNVFKDNQRVPLTILNNLS